MRQYYTKAVFVPSPDNSHEAKRRTFRDLCRELLLDTDPRTHGVLSNLVSVKNIQSLQQAYYSAGLSPEAMKLLACLDTAKRNFSMEKEIASVTGTVAPSDSVERLQWIMTHLMNYRESELLEDCIRFFYQDEDEKIIDAELMFIHQVAKHHFVHLRRIFFGENPLTMELLPLSNCDHENLNQVLNFLYWFWVDNFMSFRFKPKYERAVESVSLDKFLFNDQCLIELKQLVNALRENNTTEKRVKAISEFYGQGNVAINPLLKSSSDDLMRYFRLLLSFEIISPTEIAQLNEHSIHKIDNLFRGRADTMIQAPTSPDSLSSIWLFFLCPQETRVSFLPQLIQSVKREDSSVSIFEIMKIIVSVNQAVSSIDEGVVPLYAISENQDMIRLLIESVRNDQPLHFSYQKIDADSHPEWILLEGAMDAALLPNLSRYR